MATDQEDFRPVPDPTFLTTQQILHEVALCREVIETRLNAMDKANELLQRASDKLPRIYDVAASVSELQELHDQKFHSIAMQFQEQEQTSRDSKLAVDAALQAAKEAVQEHNKSSALGVAKSEAATTKQIDQIVVLINTTTGALNDKIDDLKVRLTTIEGYSKGVTGVWGYFVGMIGVLVGMATLFVLLVKSP